MKDTSFFVWYVFTCLHHLSRSSLNLLQCQPSVLQAGEEDAQSSPKEDFADRFAKALKQGWDDISYYTEKSREGQPAQMCAPKGERIFPALWMDQKACSYISAMPSLHQHPSTSQHGFWENTGPPVSMGHFCPPAEDCVDSQSTRRNPP